MNSPKRKIPLSIIAVLFCSLTFVTLLYTERVSFSSSSISQIKYLCSSIASKSNSYFKCGIDDGSRFDPEECSVVHGKWTFNKSFNPLYTDTSCPYLDRQVSCIMNGRPDSDYLHWEWQPRNCTLPRFDPDRALKKLRGKRLMFVGDSVQKYQWESFVCMIASIIPEDKRSMEAQGLAHSIFTAKEYDAKIEFYWAPFLIESNTDIDIVADPDKRVLKVDSVAKHAKYWEGVDILVFNTYIWWTSRLSVKTLWGSFANGEEGYEVMDTRVAYRMALRTWANWIDSTVNPNKTRVLFTTMSPIHIKSAEWNHTNGIKCYNETRPVMNKFWGSNYDGWVMSVVDSVMSRMKVPVTFINITQLSDYRVDGHTSVYTERGGELLTEEQKADPLHHADCIHWCLPGIPDTWNQILLAYL
ncbi:hypothetical protein HS088_TW05G00355 [Tripterygium wilfordii]|uniref:Trichome birefringence-like N-terminal domain-containing protein n=1 Tax=Tripterygium wilfordii TaxID=458696 RepID=A0A7J7DMX2_TRIWF|nr:protein trichome birefringence-like 3 [Tripterygium wilfordii]KAF5747629.1 hypothetical protein HS088_TW05G00355 [Tripterygium wilfordii]